MHRLFGLLDNLCHLGFFVKKRLVSFLADNAQLITYFGKAHICVVLTEFDAVLRSCSHHTIGLVGALCHKVINEHTNICFITAQDERCFAFNLSHCIDTCHKALRPCLFIATASVDLTCGKKVFDRFCFKGGFQCKRIYAIVLDCVGVLCKTTVFKAGESAIHLFLHVVRER